MKGILFDSLTEVRHRKVVWIFVALTVLGILAVIGASAIEISMGAEDATIGDLSSEVSIGIVFVLTWISHKILIPLTVLLSAGVIPNMLTKGRIDFYLSKPVTRSSLLVSKTLATWMIYTILAVASLIVVWLSGAIFLDGLSSRIFYTIALIVVSTFCWVSVVCFAGVVTQRTPTVLAIVFATFMIQWGLSQRELIAFMTDNEVITYTVDTLYYIFPKTGELYDNTQSWVMGTSRKFEMVPLFTTLAFSVVLMFVTSHIFKRKNY